MPNPIIPRETVHTLAEACADAGAKFQSTGQRLMKQQRRLGRFFEQNVETLGVQEADVALYMCSVCLRIFEQVGGRMYKINGNDIEDATKKIAEISDSLFPADKEFPTRVREIEWRAQPHLLDEILWALYEKTEDELSENEVTVPEEKSALVFLVMWAAVEAMNARWIGPETL